MLKPYRDQFVDGLNNYVWLHPSTWTFAHFSKNIEVAIVSTGGVLSLLCVFNGFAASLFSVWLTLCLFIWFSYLMAVQLRSFRMLKKHYNQYLFPIEVAFNAMKNGDQKKYADTLKTAYITCSRGYPDEFGELEKIRELFELTAPANKIFSLDEELALKRKQLKEEEEYDKYIQDIADELK